MDDGAKFEPYDRSRFQFEPRLPSDEIALELDGPQRRRVLWFEKKLPEKFAEGEGIAGVFDVWEKLADEAVAQFRHWGPTMCAAGYSYLVAISDKATGRPRWLPKPFFMSTGICGEKFGEDFANAYARNKAEFEGQLEIITSDSLLESSHSAHSYYRVKLLSVFFRLISPPKGWPGKATKSEKRAVVNESARSVAARKGWATRRMRQADRLRRWSAEEELRSRRMRDEQTRAESTRYKQRLAGGFYGGRSGD